MQSVLSKLALKKSCPDENDFAAAFGGRVSSAVGYRTTTREVRVRIPRGAILA